MWDPQHLTALQASKACYGDSFTFFLLLEDTRRLGGTCRLHFQGRIILQINQQKSGWQAYVGLCNVATVL
jgi:hypothetical protein